MSVFQPVRIEDRKDYVNFLAAAKTQNSSVSFGNLFLWDYLCRRNVLIAGERFCAEYCCCHGLPFFAFPIGSGELRPAIEAMDRRSREQGYALELRAVSVNECEELERAYPGRFEFRADRDNFDYIYSVESMATLSGKKLHGKRNFCNRFESNYTSRAERITPALFDDCRKVLSAWDREKSGGSDEENEAIERAFQYWSELELTGTLLYADDKPVAFTVAELIREDTADVHFEKALDEFPGSYPMIARDLARQLRIDRPNIIYVNREEDMGIPGLRKAKEEWYPLAMLEKYTVTERRER